jgi:hypothetical protein
MFEPEDEEEQKEVEEQDLDDYEEFGDHSIFSF